MQIHLTKIVLLLMFIFVLFSNVCNYVSIATTNWIKTTTGQFTIWTNFNLVIKALIATGTALNCLSLIFAFISILSLCVRKIRDQLAMIFVFGCLMTTLLALLFNATGWYQIMVTNKIESYDWSFWVMVGSFASSILAAVDASCIVGCSFAANRLKQEQEANKLKQQTYPVATTNQAYILTNEPRTKNQESSNYQTEYFVYQNEAIYQSDSRVLRL